MAKKDVDKQRHLKWTHLQFGLLLCPLTNISATWETFHQLELCKWDWEQIHHHPTQLAALFKQHKAGLGTHTSCCESNRNSWMLIRYLNRIFLWLMRAISYLLLKHPRWKETSLSTDWWGQNKIHPSSHPNKETANMNTLSVKWQWMEVDRLIFKQWAVTSRQLSAWGTLFHLHHYCFLRQHDNQTSRNYITHLPLTKAMNGQVYWDMQERYERRMI